MRKNSTEEAGSRIRSRTEFMTVGFENSTKMVSSLGSASIVRAEYMALLSTGILWENYSVVMN
jgi:hypothetical protein